jgi:hypothetical protein
VPIPPSDDEAEADSLVCYCGANESDPDVDDINENYESDKDGPVMYGRKEEIAVLPMEETYSTAMSESPGPAAEKAEVKAPIPTNTVTASQPFFGFGSKWTVGC